MNDSMVAETTLAYLAGAVDSDGWIGLNVKKHKKWASTYQPRVTLKQVTPQIPELLHETFAGHLYLASPSATKGRPLHVWSATHRIAKSALEQLVPYLRIKPRQARLMIEVADLCANARGFLVPPVIDGEPLLTVAEVIERTGRSEETVRQAVRQKSIPAIRQYQNGHTRVLIPESFLPIWATRGSTPGRHPEVTARLEEIHDEIRVLNKVGI